jgi:hypothetical protein
MALDDLDLEFEDEDEMKKKKNDAVHQDVDLEFHGQDSDEDKPKAARPASPAAAHPHGAQPMGQVKRLDEARAAAQPIKRPTTPGQPAPRVSGDSAAPINVGATALKSQPQAQRAPQPQSQSRQIPEGQYDLESEEIVQLRERVRKAEFDAEVRVQVAEFKTELLSELLGDMKLMDHQVNQLLVRINAKHPDMKQEVLMIKKILADFTTKKRK